MKPTIDTEQRNECALEVLRMAAPMLKRLAFQFNMEYDELYQMAAEVALLSYEKALTAEVPRAFLYGVVRNVLWYKPEEEPTVSLDAPLTSDSDTRLADLVPAPRLFEVDPNGLMRKERALYSSLRKLPLEVQLYICRVHEIHAYTPKPPKKGRFKGKRLNFSRDPATLSRLAYHSLRRDKKLAHVVLGTPLKRELNFEQDWD